MTLFQHLYRVALHLEYMHIKIGLILLFSIK